MTKPSQGREMLVVCSFIMFVFEVTINPVGINWWSLDDAAGVSPTVIKIR